MVKKSIIILGGFVACLLIIAGIAISFGKPAFSDSITRATTRQPEPYTELYFTKTTQLSRTYSADTPLTFTFTIHNHEAKSIRYPYQISIDNTVASTDTTPLIIDNATLPIRQTLTISSTKPRVQIAVKLLNTNQTIHFWTQKE